jgi:hypothetical protein
VGLVLGFPEDPFFSGPYCCSTFSRGYLEKWSTHKKEEQNRSFPARKFRAGQTLRVFGQQKFYVKNIQ